MTKCKIHNTELRINAFKKPDGSWHAYAVCFICDKHEDAESIPGINQYYTDFYDKKPMTVDYKELPNHRDQVQDMQE